MQEQNGKTASARFEVAVGLVLLALPLLYLLTDRARDPWVGRWSKAAVLGMVLAAVAVGVFLGTYRLTLPRWVRGLRKGLVVLGFSLLLALLAGEAALAMLDESAFEETANTGRHAPDPDVGHVYYPDHEQMISSREFRTHWRSNAQGLRAERDYGPKPPGVKRVLVVGDSFTVGDQVAFADTYPAAAERLLGDESGVGRVEVLNAGFPGFGTVDEARWIAKFAASLEPDVVVIGMTPNDLLENRFPKQYVAQDGALVSAAATDADRAVWAARKQWSCLAGWVQRSRLRKLQHRSMVLKRLLGKPSTRHHRAFQAEPDETSRQQFDLAAGYLLEARQATEAMGARFGLLLIPFRDQLVDLEDGLDPAAFGRRWSAFGADHGFPVRDALPAFQAHPRPGDLYWREDSHCTAEGYHLIGQELHGLLVDHAALLGLSE